MGETGRGGAPNAAEGEPRPLRGVDMLLGPSPGNTILGESLCVGTMLTGVEWRLTPLGLISMPWYLNMWARMLSARVNVEPQAVHGNLYRENTNSSNCVFQNTIDKFRNAPVKYCYLGSVAVDATRKWCLSLAFTILEHFHTQVGQRATRSAALLVDLCWTCSAP